MKSNRSFITRSHFLLILVLFLVANTTINKKTSTTNFYISKRGDDSANGLTPNTPWLTIEKINNSKFSPGDSILFNRGDAWREGQALYGSSNGTVGKPIVFGAYGKGEKPLILASKDISSSVFWTNSSENIWMTTSKINITTRDGREQITPDVANLIFNNEESIGFKKRFLKSLRTQGDFCLNLVDTILYMYSVTNPSKYYKRIEATGIRNCENNIEVINGHYLSLTNLDIRYSKNNGLFLQNCSNIEISNCDFSWIGGCYYPIQTFWLDSKDHARMGNGVQLWQGNSNVVVRNCKINQVYDAGISPQGEGKSYSIRNLRFHHNLINNCYYSFEFWGRPSTSTADSIFFENNTCLNAGCGWSTLQRPDKNSSAHIKLFGSNMVFSNVFIRNNIFKESANLCMYSEHEYSDSNKENMWSAFTLDNNCYYQSSNEKQVIRWRGGSAKGGGDFFMSDLYSYQMKSGKERHSVFSDPMLNSEYTLKFGSPAIDTGIDVGYPYCGNAPDMGAFDMR